MRTAIMVLIVILLIVSTQKILYANTTMNGTGTVTNLTKDTVRISGITYSLHKNAHVGIYQQSGFKVLEETRSLKAIEPGQEVRFKTYGNMVLELIILKR